MVQNIRPPQDFPVVPRQSWNVAIPVRRSDSRAEAGSKAPIPEPVPTREQVEQVVTRVKESLSGTNSRLKIEIDSDVNRVVIKILDGESGEIIRQIPSQELLDLAKHLDGSKGFLVRERA
jgi:flagellar protein FlaG